VSLRWLIRALRLFLRTAFPFVLSLLCLVVNSTAWADSQTDRFQNYGREQLQKLRKTPYPCAAFWSSSGRERYVVDMRPFAAAAGLRRGDRPVAYGEIALTGNDDSDNEVWARLPHSEYVDVRVDRAGKEVSIRLPCRDDRPSWEASSTLWRAVAEGRWQDCIDAVSAWIKVTGYAPSGSMQIGVLCMLEKSKSERRRPPDEYWRRLHAWPPRPLKKLVIHPLGYQKFGQRCSTP
jgi:hypothetical protein